MILPERKSNRLKGHDYSRPGAYFITVCIKDRVEYFGNIKDGRMVMNEYGEIVEKQWLWLGNQYNYIELDAFGVMPNHIHGIICITGNNITGDGDNGDWDDDIVAGNGNFVGNGGTIGNGRDRSLQRKIKPIPEIVGAFKTTSSKLIHRAGLEPFRWQKSYYDHIVRNNTSLQNIRRYITDNPVNWDRDEENRNAYSHL